MSNLLAADSEMEHTEKFPGHYVSPKTTEKNSDYNQMLKKKDLLPYSHSSYHPQKKNFPRPHYFPPTHLPLNHLELSQ